MSRLVIPGPSTPSKMLKDNLLSFGTLRVELRDEHGNIKHDETYNNLVVNAGLAFIAQSLLKTTSDTPARMTHMGVGDSNTAAAAAQTDLQAATNKVRVALTSQTNVTGTVANDSVQYIATFPAGTGTWTITEAGIFNAGAAGTMLSRAVIGPIAKGALDSLTITWNVRAGT